MLKKISTTLAGVILGRRANYFEGIRSPVSSKIIPLSEIQGAERGELRFRDDSSVSVQLLKELGGLAPRKYPPKREGES